MQREYLIDSLVAALPNRAKRYEVADEDIPNFAVRVGARTKTFILIARFGGSEHSTRQTIGKFRKMKTEEARRIAVAWNDAMKQGIDPVEVRKRERRAQALKLRCTFRSVVEDYIASLPSRQRNRNVKKEAAFIRLNLINPATNVWMNKPIAQVEDHHVSALVGAIKARGAIAQALKTLKTVRTFFNWAMLPERRMAIGLERNPIQSLTPRLMQLHAGTRTRHFLHKEMRAYLLAAAATPYPWGPFQRALIETGQRRGDVAGMRWSQIDFKENLWVIPGGTGKPEEDHIVPLSKHMFKMLRSLRSQLSPHHGDFVFSLSNGQRPVSSFGKEKKRFEVRLLAELQKIAPGKQLRPWVWHDLRRTLRTHFSGFASDQVAETAIGHGQKGIQRVYNLFKYRREIRAAFNIWSEILRKVAEGTATVSDLEHWNEPGDPTKEPRP